jgi:hypothetical protein
MDQKLEKILEEASQAARQWPEWRKSEALKATERTSERTRHAMEETGNQNHPVICPNGQ